MPAFAPNFTARVKVRYHAALANHTQVWRCSQLGVAFIEADACIAAIQGLYDLLTPSMFDDWSVLDVSVAEFNSDVFLPHGTITAIGTVPVAGVDPKVKADAISFVGRTLGGQPAKIAQFGYAINATVGDDAGDYRITVAEDPQIDGAIALLNSFTVSGAIRGSDGLGIVWKAYANTKPYDYWVKRVRNGG
jgi:hypothetical protein